MAKSTKGPAFEIRFCEGNKVQVYDLSKKGHVLPSEYLEDDVANGRLRYSKLGNQWIPPTSPSSSSINEINHTGINQEEQNDENNHSIPLSTIIDDQNESKITTHSLNSSSHSPYKEENMDDHPKKKKFNEIPVIAKQKAIEDARELESIRQAEEAVRKAMERKQKIERARLARQKAKAEAESESQHSNEDINNEKVINEVEIYNNDEEEESVYPSSPQPSYPSVKKEHTIITDMSIDQKQKSDNTMAMHHQPSTPVPQQQQYYNKNNDHYLPSPSSSITPLPTALQSSTKPTYYNQHHNNNLNNNNNNNNMMINHNQSHYQPYHPPNINNNNHLTSNNYNEDTSFFHQDMDDHHQQQQNQSEQKKKNSSCCCVIS